MSPATRFAQVGLLGNAVPQHRGRYMNPHFTLWQPSPQPLKARRKIISQQRFSGINAESGNGPDRKAGSSGLPLREPL